MRLARNGGTPCRITSAVNAGSAWLNGFEVAYLQHLTSCPVRLLVWGISANYGLYCFSYFLWPDFSRTDHPRLVRNAPHTWNVSPTYDRGRVSLRAGLSYNAQNIAAYGDGTPGPFGDNYFYPIFSSTPRVASKWPRGLSFVMYGSTSTMRSSVLQREPPIHAPARVLQAHDRRGFRCPRCMKNNQSSVAT